MKRIIKGSGPGIKDFLQRLSAVDLTQDNQHIFIMDKLGKVILDALWTAHDDHNLFLEVTLESLNGWTELLSKYDLRQSFNFIVTTYNCHNNKENAELIIFDQRIGSPRYWHEHSVDNYAWEEYQQKLWLAKEIEGTDAWGHTPMDLGWLPRAALGRCYPGQESIARSLRQNIKLEKSWVDNNELNSYLQQEKNGKILLFADEMIKGKVLLKGKTKSLVAFYKTSCKS